MGFDFSADDVYQIGEAIEVNGEQFYRAASKAVEDAKLKGALADLARQESAHQTRFAQLRERLSETERAKLVFDPDDENALYLKATADSHVFSRDVDPASHFDGVASPMEALRLALRFEKDSIVFFLGMKEFVPQTAGVETIDWLVREEMKHVKQIAEMMKHY